MKKLKLVIEVEYELNLEDYLAECDSIKSDVVEVVQTLAERGFVTKADLITPKVILPENTLSLL